MSRILDTNIMLDNTDHTRHVLSLSCGKVAAVDPVCWLNKLLSVFFQSPTRNEFILAWNSIPKWYSLHYAILRSLISAKKHFQKINPRKNLTRLSENLLTKLLVCWCLLTSFLFFLLCFLSSIFGMQSRKLLSPWLRKREKTRLTKY